MPRRVARLLASVLFAVVLARARAAQPRRALLVGRGGVMHMLQA